MFAKRTEWELAANTIAVSLENLRRAGTTVFDLTESNPTSCGFVFPSSEILTPLSQLPNMEYAPSARGNLKAREAIACYYAGKNISVSPDQIFLTASTSEGYSFLFRLLAGPGERILFPCPSYPLFEFLAGLNDLHMDFYPLIYEGQWTADFAGLKAMINTTTRAIALVNPNNPTGSFFKPGELQTLNRICQTHRLPIIADEVFLDYRFEKSGDALSLAKNRESLTFVLGGLSKMLGLPQMKLSWIVVNGPADLVQEAAGRLEVIADTYLSVNTPVQNALPQWLPLRSGIQGEIMGRIRRNYELLRRIFTDGGEGEVLRAEGGWYAVVKLPSGIDEEDFVTGLLEKYHVYVHPGYFFNFQDEPYIIVSLLPPEEIFREGLRRVWEFLSSFVKREA